jgi:hypothetical protein
VAVQRIVQRNGPHFRDVIPSRNGSERTLSNIAECIFISTSTASSDGKPTPQCFPFLRWAVDVHQPFWLTTRDAHGQHDGILRAFRAALGAPTLPMEVETLLRAVRPSKWRGNKVSGIDLASDFVWIDDDPLLVEIDALRGLGLLDRLLIVDGDDGLLRATWRLKRGLTSLMRESSTTRP